VGTRFAVVVVGAPVHGADHLGAPAAPYLAALEPLGGRRAAVSPGPAGPPCLFLVATGGSERALLDLWGGEGPLFLLAHPGHNSLPAALEALAAVRRQDGAWAIHDDDQARLRFGQVPEEEGQTDRGGDGDAA